MNKSDFIDSIAAKTGLTKKDSSAAIDAIQGAIGEALAAGDSVTVVGFGTFSTSERAARAGRNPRTGKEIQIKAAKVPRFKPGKLLKDSL